MCAQDQKFIEAVVIALAYRNDKRATSDKSRKALLTSMLGCAARFNFEHAAATFAHLGADVNAPDRLSKHTPLMHAVLRENEELLRILLDHGADPTVRHPKLGPWRIRGGCCVVSGGLNFGFRRTQWGSEPPRARTPRRMVWRCAPQATPRCT